MSSFGKSARFQAWPEGFDFLYDPFFPATDEQVTAIAAALNVEKDSEHVAAVLAAVRRFDGRETAIAALPKGDHRIRDLETLATLARAMDGLNINVLRLLARYGADLGFCDGAVIAAAARCAADDLKTALQPQKRGPKSKASRAATFRELAEIYTRATGKRATISTTTESGKTQGGQPAGPFFRFMRAAVAPVPSLQRLTDHALAQAMRRREPKDILARSIR